MSSRRIAIFDTTLRDGEQSPGIALRPDEKAEAARMLERLGVDVIEAGFAASSPGDFEGVRAAAAAVERVTVASLCRTLTTDIEAGAEAVRGEGSPVANAVQRLEEGIEDEPRGPAGEPGDEPDATGIAFGCGDDVRRGTRHLRTFRSSGEGDPPFVLASRRGRRREAAG